MQIVFVVAACLAASLICLDAHGPLGGSSHEDHRFHRKGNNSSRPDAERYSWNRTLDANTTVREGASNRNGSEVVFVKSRGRALRSNNFTESTSVYDFSNSTAILVYAFKRGVAPCFVASTDLTLSAVKDELAARNGSTVETANKVSLNASASPLSSEEADDLRESNPIVRFVCYRKPIFRVAPPEANAQPSENATEQVVFFDLLSEVTIAYPQRPSFPGPFGGPQFGRHGNHTEGRRLGHGPGGRSGGRDGPQGGPGGPQGGPGGPQGGPGGRRGPRGN